ncbi:multidrug efflux SMR transporter [Brevibacillus humidisoli]|uniref:DMT family transporter n=1 Tax=Brevibacillus humidisoli TaxID=2895522 RepID=UPI001E52ACB9|nr:multidrug efflux SMR transporter [Brevibacillus humidisoli]UFJ39828.1 multidrug efflux SMR transporter [Brevibacillus humidisoli]
MNWFYLILAIVLEVAGTTSMKMSQGFTKVFPSLLMFFFYAASLVSLTVALKYIEVGVAYAIWSGVGTALIAVLGILIFKESATLLKIGSLVLIILGVIGLNLGGTDHGTSQPGHAITKETSETRDYR